MALNKELRDGLRELFPTYRVANESVPVQVIKTRWPSLNDIVLGCGGIPVGRSIELYAPPSAGKTTVAINLIAEFQKQGLLCAFDDREGSFMEAKYTDGAGLDRSELVMIDSSTGNDCLF